MSFYNPVVNIENNVYIIHAIPIGQVICKNINYSVWPQLLYIPGHYPNILPDGKIILENNNKDRLITRVHKKIEHNNQYGIVFFKFTEVKLKPQILPI